MNLQDLNIQTKNFKMGKIHIQVIKDVINNMLIANGIIKVLMHYMI